MSVSLAMPAASVAAVAGISRLTSRSSSSRTSATSASSVLAADAERVETRRGSFDTSPLIDEGRIGIGVAEARDRLAGDVLPGHARRHGLPAGRMSTAGSPSGSG